MYIFNSYIFNKKVILNISLLSLKSFQNLCLFLLNNLICCINFIIVKNTQLHIFVNKDCVYDVIFFLRNSSFINCNQLLDLTMVDRLEMTRTNFRWEYVYMLLSTHNNLRIFVRGYLKTFSFLNSVVSLFNSANWLEREVWDMFGIYFKHHPDLRRILTDYVFLGSPLRKDFPLTGYVEVRYDEAYKAVVVEPLILMQELREFRLENVWQKIR